jgi:peptidoglycan/xylan/chitin deacetylase (PgdA/CDA1 family)
MNERFACMTVDLEPDFLSVDRHEVLLDESRFNAFASTLLGRGVPISAFVAAKMLDEGLPIQERFGQLDAEFQLHSYSHDPSAPDTPEEIERAKDAYRRHFGSDPEGYRAPLGFISAAGVEELAAHGFSYSSSIFPSNRRELGFNFGEFPTEPWMWANGDQDLILEIPFAVSRRPRVVICESYLKLLGMGPYRMLHRFGGFPDVVVIDSHLYDFFATSAVLSLSRLDARRYALLRNQRRALALLDRLIGFLQQRGYQFVKMSDVQAHLQERAAALPRIDISRIANIQYRSPERSGQA